MTTPFSPPPLDQAYDYEEIVLDISHIETENNEPVDNIFSEKQQRLLTEPLHSSWSGPGEERPFVATANVGVFYLLHGPPLVPDVFLSLDVKLPDDIWVKQHRSYFVWEYGKPPDVVIEVVSNKSGDEQGRRRHGYEWMHVPYYVVFDPIHQLSAELLQIYELKGTTYVPHAETWLSEVGLGLTLWSGAYEDREDQWLRWCYQDGTLVPTGAERAARAEARVERLAAQLRALGIEPEES